MEDNIVSVSVCPGCHKLTTMKVTCEKESLFYCKLCFEPFKQFKNGKLVYVPIGIARAMNNKISFVFTPESSLQDSIKNDLDDFDESEFEFEFEYDPEIDPDELN